MPPLSPLLITLLQRIELWLEQERDQLALWVPVALGVGIGLWFALPLRAEWCAVILIGLALALVGVALGRNYRLGQLCISFGLLMSLGCALIWWRTEQIAAPILAKQSIVVLQAQIVNTEVQGARGRVRLSLAPENAQVLGLPPLIRVNVDDKDLPAHLTTGERVRLKARLLPPPDASLPGGYDFARGVWFLGLGATGHAEGLVERVDASSATGETWHDRLTRMMLQHMPDSAGGIGTSFISGDRGGITQHDEDSFRASGLTHLVSVSGLHITVAVAGTMWLVMRLLTLVPGLALRLPLMAIAAGAGAAMGLFYTWLTGAEFPTIRSCVAAILIIMGLVLGREALTLRLVASGALVILLLWPEALISPAFQLSFIAVTSIIAFHDHPWARAFFSKAEAETWLGRIGREAKLIIVSGLVCEVALAPIAFFHFHRSGLYGMFSNIIGIPLTTFFIMPMEALAIVLEPLGLSAPFWWLAWKALHFLVGLSDWVASWPGAVALVPEVPLLAYLCVSFGGLWLMLWKHNARFWGLVPVVLGCAYVLMLPQADILITGDGQHMAVRLADGSYAMLRARAHDYVRGQIGTAAGSWAPMQALEDSPNTQCNSDICRTIITRNGKNWVVAATLSHYNLPYADFMKLCASVDIMVSNRYLPSGCTPRWLKLDRHSLGESGGVKIMLASQTVERVRYGRDDHPWVIVPYAARPKPEGIGD